MDKQIRSYMTLIGVHECMVLLIQNTVNHIIVEILFQIAWLIRKLNAQKHMHTINDNAVQCHLSKNLLHEIFWTHNICDYICVYM